ncbi:MAG: PIN domain-containing protein [Acidimicrobiales bacterium]
MKFLLDSNVYDELVISPERQAQVIGACQAGKATLLMTHVQHDELMAMSDTVKRDRIFGIPFEPIPTYGVVLNTSRVGLAQFGETELIDGVRSDSRGHTEDALLAATARHHDAALVTNDRRLTNQAPKIGVEVWSSGRFIEYLNETPCTL